MTLIESAVHPTPGRTRYWRITLTAPLLALMGFIKSKLKGWRK
jgi:hypothetical protein